MPELPEVETIRRDLAPELEFASVVEAGSHWSSKFTPATGAVGHRFGPLARRGKFLIAPLTPTVETSADGERRELVIHLGMTGRLGLHHFGPAGGFAPETDAGVDLAHPHLRAWWHLDGDRILTFHDIRRFGRIHVVEPGRYESMPTLHNLGPEPFDSTLDARRFHSLLKQSRRHLKTALLSQRPIAGVGNIYADEALWLSRINPKVRRLGLERADRLLSAIREVLTSAIDNRGTTLRDYRTADGEPGTNQFALKAYGRAGHRCLRCHHLLESVVLDARSTTWCSRCQAH